MRGLVSTLIAPERRWDLGSEEGKKGQIERGRAWDVFLRGEISHTNRDDILRALVVGTQICVQANPSCAHIHCWCCLESIPRWDLPVVQVARSSDFGSGGSGCDIHS